MKITLKDGIIVIACFILVIVGISGLIFVGDYNTPPETQPKHIDVNIEQESITGSSVVVEERAKVVEEEHKPTPPAPKPREQDPELIIEHRGGDNDIYIKNGLNFPIYVLKGCDYLYDLKIYDSEGELVYPRTGLDLGYACNVVPSYVEVEPGEKFFLDTWASDLDCCEGTLGIECNCIEEVRAFTVIFDYYYDKDGRISKSITKDFYA